MLKDYQTEKPVLETDRLLLRTLTEADVPDLRDWLGKDEIYTYWGRKASNGERNPELLFVDARPWVKCGFVKEGTVRRGKMVSVYCDYNIYGMLREDYINCG